MDMGWRMYMKIVILERNSVGLDISVEGFSRFGEVITYPNTVTEEEVIERIEDADVVVGNKAPLTEKTLQGAKNVKLICEFATGYDNVDLAYCSKHGIKVANVRNYSTDAVAQHTFALCLYVLEMLPRAVFQTLMSLFLSWRERPGVSSAWEISDARLHRLQVRLDAA